MLFQKDRAPLSAGRVEGRIFRSSQHSLDFLYSWVAHSDCMVWVEQAAMFIETLRWSVDFLAKKTGSPPNLGALLACDAVWSPDVTRDYRQFYQQHCENRPKLSDKPNRNCEFTLVGGPMECSTNGDLYKTCLTDGFTKLREAQPSGSSASVQLPGPVFFWQGLLGEGDSFFLGFDADVPLNTLDPHDFGQYPTFVEERVWKQSQAKLA